jgi:hypothetical protein
MVRSSARRKVVAMRAGRCGGDDGGSAAVPCKGARLLGAAAAARPWWGRRRMEKPLDPSGSRGSGRERENEGGFAVPRCSSFCLKKLREKG